MNPQAIDRAILLAQRIGHVLLATADNNMVPHVAAAGNCARLDDGRLAITEWFCPGTLTNLDLNPHLAVVVWDPVTDSGFQIVGEVEGVEDLAVLDGYDPAVDSASLPQVQRRLVVCPRKVFEFTLAPHSDREE